MNLAGLALRNLGRRPVRTALSILGIALAVGSALALIALSRSIQETTRDGMDEIGDDLAVTQRGASDIFGGFLPEDTEGRVGQVQGVTQVSGGPMRATCGRTCRCAKDACRPRASGTSRCSATPSPRRSTRRSATASRSWATSSP